MTAVVRRLGDIMLLDRDEQHCAGYVHYTSLGVPPVETPISFSEVTQGYPLGQTTAWVDGQTLWVTAHAEDEVSPVYWQVDAFLLGAEDQSIKLVLGEHVYLENMLVVMEAADLDDDGDQEVVVATPYTSDGTNTNIMVTVLDFEISPALNIVTLETITIATDRDSPLSFSLALSDLDGKGVKNELVVAIKTLYDWSGITLQVYQYDGSSHTLALKAETTLDLVLNYGMSNYFGSQIQVGTGDFYSGYPGQQIVVSDLDVYYWTTENNIWVFPTVRTYYVDTLLSEWEIEALSTLI